MGIIAGNSVQTNADGIVNRAVGFFNTDATAAAADTITVGFQPRTVRLHNLTDRISDEWFEDMLKNSLKLSVIGIAAKLDADGGVTDTNYAALWTPASNTYTAIQTALRGLLAKLDADAGVTDTNYLSLWNPTAATQAALRASIVGLVAKLDLDGGVTDVDYASTWTPAANMSLHTVANGTRTLDVTNGLAVEDGVITMTATTLVASKSFYWEAIS